MHKEEFFAALRRALAALPEQEQKNVLQYYEDYFLDAEGESEEEIVRSLGDPQKIAGDILKDYKELQPCSGAQEQPPLPGIDTPQPRRWKGVPPWLLVVLALLALPMCLLIGIPILGGVVTIAGGAVMTVLFIVLALIFLPLVLFGCGVAFIFFAFFALGASFGSAILTFGMGLALLGLSGLSGLLFIKLFKMFVPPLTRGFVSGVHRLLARMRRHVH